MYLYYTGNVKHPGNFDYIKEGRGHNVCLAVSKDGATLDSKQCLLTNRDYPAGLTCHVRDPKGIRLRRPVLHGAGCPHAGGQGRSAGAGKHRQAPLDPHQHP